LGAGEFDELLSEKDIKSFFANGVGFRGWVDFLCTTSLGEGVPEATDTIDLLEWMRCGTSDGCVAPTSEA